MKTKSLFIHLIFAMAVIGFLSACGAHYQVQIADEDKPLATYVSARAAFNNILESYLNYRSTIHDPTELQELRDKYEKRFDEAKTALDVWGKIIDAGTDPANAAKAYSDLIDTLILELIETGILGGN